MKEELHSLKTLYYSQDENNRELAREIIKGNPSLKKTLFEDVKELYNEILDKKIKRVTKTTQEVIYKYIYEQKGWVTIYQRSTPTDIIYLNPEKLSFITKDEGEISLDYIWGMDNLKLLSVWGFGKAKITIPETAKHLNIRSLSMGNLSKVTGLQNLPTDIVNLEISDSNLSSFSYSYIKDMSKLRYLSLSYNRDMEIDYDIFSKTDLTKITLYGCDKIDRSTQIIGNYTRQSNSKVFVFDPSNINY